MFIVIIAGTRDFADYEALKTYADYKLSRIKDDIEIVSGGAREADALGEQYAREKGYSIKRFPTEWQMYEKSRGTKNMIGLAKANSFKVGVYQYRKE